MLWEETREAQGESFLIPILRCFFTEGLQDCFDKEMWSNIRGHFVGSERNLKFNVPHLRSFLHRLSSIYVCF